VAGPSTRRHWLLRNLEALGVNILDPKNATFGSFFGNFLVIFGLHHTFLGFSRGIPLVTRQGDQFFLSA